MPNDPADNKEETLHEALERALRALALIRLRLLQGGVAKDDGT